MTIFVGACLGGTPNQSNQSIYVLTSLDDQPAFSSGLSPDMTTDLEAANISAGSVVLISWADGGSNLCLVVLTLGVLNLQTFTLDT
jgi:hypothetical protein